MGAPALAPRSVPAPARPSRRAPQRKPRPRAGSRAAPAKRTPRRRPNNALASRRRAPAPRPIQLAQPAMAGAAQAAVRTAGAVRDISDSSAIVRLTRGRGWIALLCALLGGIVALNVISLSLTTVSGQTTQQISELERANSTLRGELAEQLSASRVEAWSASAGLAVPHPRDIGYLDPDQANLERVLGELEEGTLLSGADEAPTEVVSTAPAVPSDYAEVPPAEQAPAYEQPAAPPPAAPAPTSGSGGVGL